MKDDMVTHSKWPRKRMKKTWTLPLQFFVRDCILTRKKKIAMIAWAHTVGQGRRDKVWLLEMQYLESNSGNLEIYYVMNRKPVEITKIGVMWKKRDLWATTRASAFCTSCRRAKFETDVEF